MCSSLAEPLINKSFQERRGREVFEHLPQNHDLKDIALARETTITYIESLVDACLAKEEY